MTGDVGGRAIEHPCDVVALHPRVVTLGRTAREQVRVDAFAIDVARWLFGEPRDTLGPLARVVTVVAQRELRDPRRLCDQRPLLAVEAAARAVESLWPLLRGPLEPDPPEPQPEGGGGEQPPPDGAPEPEQPEDEGDGDEGDGVSPQELLARLAEQDVSDDPELSNLAQRLAAAFGQKAADIDLAAAAGQELSRGAEAALDGALESDRVSRHLEQFLPGVGWSVAPGHLEGSLLDRLDRLTELLGKLPELEELADALGRMEEESEHRGDTRGGSEELVGVRLGGDVAQALPSELALLAVPELEDLFYQRWIEHRLVSLELDGAGIDGGSQGDERGPIIACIDTSGSMEGAPELAAKALVLAVCRRALPQGRTVHLVLFGGRDDRVELRLRRGRGGLEGLLDFLSLGFHGGTDFDQPLIRALELLKERDLDKADVLVVTDGLARAGRDTIDAVAATRAERHVRFWSVVFGTGDPFGVEPFYEVFLVDPRGGFGGNLLKRVTR